MVLNENAKCHCPATTNARYPNIAIGGIKAAQATDNKRRLTANQQPSNEARTSGPVIANQLFAPMRSPLIGRTRIAATISNRGLIK